ncbi:MAG: glycosyltransferase family 39 protein [Anaerolineae bacterium]|nr:glycosyltransferase family 39 protein [Anaerolineae bacterium]
MRSLLTIHYHYPLSTLPVGFLLLLAAALRLWDLAWVQIGYDELISLKLALEVLQGQWLAHAAYSGSVANHPPVYVYVMALGYLVSKDFLWIVAYHALLDVVSVGLVYYIGRRYFGGWTGFVAGLLYAVAPWPIEFARHTWLTPQPIFTSIMLLGMMALNAPSISPAASRLGVVNWGVLLLGWGFTGLVGSHLSGIYFLPVLGLALWMGRRRVRLPALIFAFLPLLIIASAYLNFDRTQGFKNVQALFSASGAAERPAQFDLDSFKFALWNTGGAHLSDITGERYGEWRSQIPEWLTWLDTAQIALMLLAIGICAWLAIRRRSAPILLVLLTWLLPVLLQVRHAIPLGPAYFIAHVPAAFLLAGIAFQSCKVAGCQVAGGELATLQPATCNLPPATLLPATLLLATLILWHMFTWAKFNQFVQTHDTSIGGYGTPAYSAYYASKAARQAAPEGAWVVFVTQEPPSPYNLQTVLADVMLADVPHRIMHPADGLILRQTALPYVLAPDAAGFADDLAERWQVTPLAQSRAALRNLPAPNAATAQKNTGYTYLNLPPHDQTLAPIAKLSNGAEILSAKLSRQGQQAQVDLTVRVTQAPPAGAQFQWFNHLLSGGSANERMIGQTDGAGIKTANWRPGDILRQRFSINLPPDAPPPPYRLRLGSYLLNGPRLTLAFANGKTDDKLELSE